MGTVAPGRGANASRRPVPEREGRGPGALAESNRIDVSTGH